jgi:hypothetical protein
MALVAVAALGMAACGDDDEEASETTTPTTEARAQGSASVTVDMLDFSFAVSGPLTAGGTMTLANKGKEFHVAAMGKLKPGKSLADLQAILSQGPPGGEGGGEETTTTSAGRGATTTTARGSSTSTSTAGGAGGGEEEGDPTDEILDLVGPPGGFMSPGESVDVTVPNLGAGTYAFICFIPSEGDGAPHFAKGMISQMEVVEGTAPPAPTADATYKVAPGRAVEGPATLPAGRHTLKIEAAAGSDQLEPAIARLNPGTTFTQLDNVLDNLFESDDPPAPGAANRVPGQIVHFTLDLGSTTTYYVTTDLRAGNYVLVANDTDAEDGPTPPRELLNIRVT